MFGHFYLCAGADVWGGGGVAQWHLPGVLKPYIVGIMLQRKFTQSD